jgi:hypothetical protein
MTEKPPAEITRFRRDRRATIAGGLGGLAAPLSPLSSNAKFRPAASTA